LLAYVILTLGEAMGFDHRTGIFLYPGAEFDEELVMALWLLTVASGELFVGLRQ